jgi:hypothetical protein
VFVSSFLFVGQGGIFSLLSFFFLQARKKPVVEAPDG